MNHQSAKALVDTLVPDSPKLNLLTRVVGKLESNYGQYAYTGPDGKQISGTNNWGAITGSYKGKYFLAVDSKWSKEKGSVEQYSTKFRLYPTPDEGVADLAALLASKYAAAVAAVPDWQAVSRTLYGYYLGVGATPEASQKTWQAKAEKVAHEIQAATGETFPPVSKASAESGGLVLVGALLAGGFWLLRRKVKRNGR